MFTSPLSAAVDLDSMLERHNRRFGAAENLTVCAVHESGARYFVRVRKRAGGNALLPSLACVEAFLAGVVRSTVAAPADLDSLAEVFASPVEADAFALGFRICGGREAVAETAVAPLALAA